MSCHFPVLLYHQHLLSFVVHIYLRSKLDTPICAIQHEHFLRGIAFVLLEYEIMDMVKV